MAVATTTSRTRLTRHSRSSPGIAVAQCTVDRFTRVDPQKRERWGAYHGNERVGRTLEEVETISTGRDTSAPMIASLAISRGHRDPEG
jgi:hypothetical protein